MSKPGVVFQPEVYHGMQKGINQLVDAIRPTLGPLPRIVAIEQTGQPQKTPELLDNGGVIVRRILELPNRDVDMGAMYLRHLLWRIHQDVGDGTATAAVLFQAVFNEGVRFITAGGNAMLLRRSLEEGQKLIDDRLQAMSIPLTDPQQLVQMAESVCYDADITRELGHIFDIIGEHGYLQIRSGRSREVEREYVEGTFWPSKLLSKGLNTSQVRPKAVLYDAAILISDLDIENVEQTAAFLSTIKRAGIQNLFIIGRKFSDNVLGFLHRINQESIDLTVYAAQTLEKIAPDQADAMQDLAVLTGGRVLIREAGDTLPGATSEDLGAARRIWADRYHLGIVRGQGDAHQIREQLELLRLGFNRATDDKIRRKFQTRMGRLLGGSAILWVGAATETEIESRKTLAERAAHTLRAALRNGIVPGGGVALLACQTALQEKADINTQLEERAAYRILHTAMEAPLRAIVNNAGFEASVALSRLSGANAGFDARSGAIVDMVEAGIWDATAVLRTAVHGAISGAALALTTDVLIHHKNPQQAMEP